VKRWKAGTPWLYLLSLPTTYWGQLVWAKYFEFCYFTLKLRDLKIVDNIFICAIMAANSQVAMLARMLSFLSAGPQLQDMDIKGAQNPPKST
jgi:hypothetical protein